MRQNRVIQTGSLLLVGLLSFATSSVGQHMNAQDAPCRPPSSNAELTQCFVSASRGADGKMNQTLEQVRMVLGAEEQKELQAAQELWLKFRETNCSAERHLYDGGTAAPAVYAACMEADTRQRTAELKTMYGWRVTKFSGRASPSEQRLRAVGDKALSAHCPAVKARNAWFRHPGLFRNSSLHLCKNRPVSALRGHLRFRSNSRSPGDCRVRS
jgi:uncharacterized protein YecT (DUF1311 family)